jgi:hypothetical protein
MDLRVIRHKKRGITSIIGGVIMFAMLFTIGFYYFYFISQDNNFYQQAQQNSDALQSQQYNEHLVVYGITSNGNLGFTVNNTGIATQISAFWIFNGTTPVLLQYKNSTTLPNVLPQPIGQGGSWSYTNTSLLVSSSTQRYTIKVLTMRGTQAIGTYPSNIVSSQGESTVEASSIGSLIMTFSTFNWYDYSSGPSGSYTGSPPSSCSYNGGCNQYFDNLCSNGKLCSGSSYVVDLNHPHSGSLMPEGYNLCTTSSQTQGGGSHQNTVTTQNCNYWQVPMVVSMTVTNEDPNLGNIILNSESNLWITETCDFGTTEGVCPNGNPVFVFYLVNVNPATGAVSSTSQGSFAQVIIPYGTSKTIYFGSSYDLSQNSFGPVALTTYSSTGEQNVNYYGEFATFLLFSGTKVTATTVTPYGQNIPFESLIASDNLAYFSETPMTCKAGTQSTFSLTLNNSNFSPPDQSTYGDDGINELVVNATAFTLGTLPSAPSGWTGTLNSPNTGYITWSGGLIKNGTSVTFSWKGTPLAGDLGTQIIIPMTIYWASGSFTTLSVAEVCND